jgi:undecaprenyl-diphosphatase
VKPAATGGPSFVTQTWRSHRLILLGVSCLVCCALFVALAAAVSERETQSIDQAIRQWMLGRQAPVGVAFFRIVTRVGEAPYLAIGGLIVAWMLVRRGARIRPIMVATIPLIPRLITHALKDSYAVLRPPGGLESAVSTSFPSGHTSAGTAIALILGYVLARDGNSPRVGLGIATLVPLLVGLSRVYLDLHWASDVAGGWIFGMAFAGAACVLYEFMRMLDRRLSGNRQP